MYPDYLRCEYLVNPLGIDVLNPRLSWIVQSDERDQIQTAYQIIVSSSEDLIEEEKGDLWDTGKVSSDQTCHIKYNGKALEPQMYCYWKVKVWDKGDQPSKWSIIYFWSMGLLKPADWSAKWIGEPFKKRPNLIRRRIKKKSSPCPLLRKEFQIEKKIRQANVYVTALGEYELRINGKKVGDRFFTPEWTDYYQRIQYQTYDVSTLIIEGINVIGAILADGWYSGHLGPGGIYYHSHYGVNRVLMLKLNIEFSDGTYEQIVSDSSWKIFYDGPIRQADHFMGEIYNAQKEQNGWDNAGFDDTEWSEVSIDNSIKGKIVAQINEPIRIIEEIRPISVKLLKNKVHIFDLGQNIAGFCKIKLSCRNEKLVSTIKLRHGEMLNDDGSVYTTNLRRATAIDTYVISNKDEKTYHPHFTYHGFQYIQVEGLEFEPSIDTLVGCAISSDTKLSGSFECSEPSLNKLWKNILWTQRDNTISVPTDCPQRDERMGWMGDVLIFSQTSIFNMDMAAFYSKWIKDIRDMQTKDGFYPNFAPYPYNRSHAIPFAKLLPAPAWADCGITLPWDLYLNYADKKILMDHYESAKFYVNYLHSKNPNLIWKKGRSLFNPNDWLNGDKIKADDYPKKGAEIPQDVFATAFFAHSTELLSKMANVLQLIKDYEFYRNLSQKIKQKFVEEFVDSEGKIKGDTQAGYAIALKFNLLPKDLRNIAINHLKKAIEKYDNRISTGFITTIMMMLELIRNSEIELANKLLLSDRFPSWIYMINQGATTMWERWDAYVKGRGFQSRFMNSFNHYAYGAIGEFLYKIILGINLDDREPGYKHIIIKPILTGSLNWVKGYYNSIHGRIEVEWKKEKEGYEIAISIPTNTTATVYLPTEKVQNIRESDVFIKEIETIVFLKIKNKKTILKINSGKYIFKFN